MKDRVYLLFVERLLENIKQNFATSNIRLQVDCFILRSMENRQCQTLDSLRECHASFADQSKTWKGS